jgi:hypothetical protein
MGGQTAKLLAIEPTSGKDPEPNQHSPSWFVAEVKQADIWSYNLCEAVVPVVL